MKRIVICCDGTWNKLSAKHVTNVVKTARIVASMDDDIPQLVYYDEGVGTTTTPVLKTIDKWLGGAFGWGLMANVEQAYRFLVFNYEPGDQIYIFGFSRGAFTARSLGGLIRNCGILQKAHAQQIAEAIKLYRHRDIDGDHPTSHAFRADYSPKVYLNDKELEWRKTNRPKLKKPTRLTVQYLGVWDTVGAMGVPNHLLVAGLFNGKYKFHDDQLSSSVLNARHAVAIDERRITFAPTTWGNLPDLNERQGTEKDSAKAPFQQKWFPGEHGSVGGGGHFVGLSNAALHWVLEGAIAAGLVLEKDALKPFVAQISHTDPLNNMRVVKKGIFSGLGRKLDRDGPTTVNDVHQSTQARWCSPAENLPQSKLYRPKTLDHIADELDKACT